MEKKIFEILEKMKLEVITLDEAHKQLCVLFGVINSNLNVPQSFIDKIDSWDDGGCSTGLNDD
jgi:hypothetical protein